MEHAGVKKGMDEAMVREIVAQTILGAAKMIMVNDETPASLREKVTSPNGTTASGLDALRKNNGGRAISQAIHHAAKRSKELNEEMAVAYRKSTMPPRVLGNFSTIKGRCMS
jgi:pyrroline-5-carboxylate reductase